MNSPRKVVRARCWREAPTFPSLLGAASLLLSLPAGVSLAVDVVEVDRFERSEVTLELIGPTGQSELVTLRGPSEMHVFFEGPSGGDAFDDDADGRDDVVTELVSLQLSGTSPNLGPVVLDLNPVNASLGGMEEQTNSTTGLLDVPPFAATGLVDSFFGVFFGIEFAGFQLHNADPMHISSVISSKPPGENDLYENREGLELYDVNGNPTGFLIGASSFIFVPEPESGLMIAAAALAALAHIKHRRAAHR
jgi:hypothetical protein